MFNARVRKHAPYDLGDVSKCMVQAIVAHVEDLPAYDAQRGVQEKNDGSGKVPDVNEWPPLLAIKDGDSAVLLRFRREKVHHEVEARAVREPKHGSKAHNDRMEIRGRAFKERPLGR